MNKEMGLIGYCAPFEDDFYTRSTMKGLFWEFKNAGLIMVGVSSYEDFPSEIVNPYDSRHVGHDMPELFANTDAWLHCFRDPKNMGLLPGMPRLNAAESDFVDTERNDGGGRLIPEGPRPSPEEREYDAVYVNRGGGWNDFNRNWALAEPAIAAMAADGVRFVVINRMPSDAVLNRYPGAKENITQLDSLPWNEYLSLVEKLGFVFAPNVHDASPRVVSEAQSLDTPVLLNRDILGGWKYLEEQDEQGRIRAGEFFDTGLGGDKNGVSDEAVEAIVEAARKLLARDAEPDRGGLAPRDNIKSKWARDNSKARLRAFFEDVIGLERLAEAKHLAVKYHIRPSSSRSLAAAAGETHPDEHSDGWRLSRALASTAGHAHEDPGYAWAKHHSPAGVHPSSALPGPVVVREVRGLADHWTHRGLEAPEIISPLGLELRFDGLRRFAATLDDPELRDFVLDTILQHGGLIERV